MTKQELLQKLQALKSRYHSPLPLQKYLLAHHTDCSIFRSVEVYGSVFCSCGLLHDLSSLHYGLVDLLYPEYDIDMDRQEGIDETPVELQEVFDTKDPQSLSSIEQDIEISCEDIKSSIQEVFATESDKVVNRYALLYYHMANWFSQNPPSEPVPTWCEIGWPIRKDMAEELILEYEKTTGRKIEDSPFNGS